MRFTFACGQIKPDDRSHVSSNCNVPSVFRALKKKKGFYSDIRPTGSLAVVSGNQTASFRKSVGGERFSFCHQSCPARSQTHAGAAAHCHQWTLGLEYLICGLSNDSEPGCRSAGPGRNQNQARTDRHQPALRFATPAAWCVCVSVCLSVNWHAVGSTSVMCIAATSPTSPRDLWFLGSDVAA